MQIGWVNIPRSKTCTQPWNQTNYDFHVPHHCKAQELFAIVCYIDEKTVKIEVITSDHLNMDFKGHIC